MKTTSIGTRSVLTAAMLIALAGCATQSPQGQPPAPTTSTETNLENEIRSQCEKEWINPSGNPEWSAIARCVERRTEGYREVQRYVQDHNIQEGDITPEADILSACHREWINPSGNPEWSAIARCVERRLSGYRKLHP